MKKSGSQKTKSSSQPIDTKIKEIGDWRGKMLCRLRTLPEEADPEVVEEWKWRGVPVWSHDGLERASNRACLFATVVAACHAPR